MSDRITTSLSFNDPQPSSSEDTIYFSLSITFDSPKHGGRHRDFIWSYFDDMGPAKIPGH
ncbi:unnamed protein product, partial [Rotaria sp. Silwood1]